MFKLTDKSGRLVIIRPDNTTPLARIAATRLKNAPRPLKMYYNQNVFRISGDYSGKRSEFSQTGIEIIGGNAGTWGGNVQITGESATLEAKNVALYQHFSFQLTGQKESQMGNLSLFAMRRPGNPTF